MISDDDLYRLAVFLGTVAMFLIVGYHFLEVNSKDDSNTSTSTSSSTAPTDKKIPLNADPNAFAPVAAVPSRGAAGKTT